MNFKRILLIVTVMCTIVFAQRPTLELLFEDSAVNIGSAAGIGEVLTVAGVEPVFSSGGLGDTKCLDMSSASSMGSSGGVVRFLTSQKVTEKLTDLRSFTITGWMKSDNSPASLAGITAFASNDSSFRLRCHSTNRLRFMLESDGDEPEYFYSSTSANYNCSDWKFFAVSYDGTKSIDNVKFYYSDSLAGELVLDSIHSYGGGTLFMDPAIFYVGNVNTSGTSVFDGLLDSIRIFSSKSGSDGALSAQSIDQWKGNNTFDPKALATIDLRFEDNLVSEGGFTDIAFKRNYNGTLPSFATNGLDGGKCLDMTVATGMGVRGPFLGFSETYSVNEKIINAKSFTITCWLKSDVIPKDGARLFSYLDTSGRGAELYFASTGRLSFSIGPFVYESDAAANYDCSQWTFIALTFDGSKTTNNVNFYYGLDSSIGQVSLDSTYSSFMSQILGDISGVNIANRGTTYPFDGLIDSFKMFTAKDDGSGALTPVQLELVMADNATSIVPQVPDNVFRKSDVAIMRTSSALPTDGYKATRVVWNYDTHGGIVDAFSALGVVASQTHNFETTSYYGNTDFTSGKYYTDDSSMPSRAKDIENGFVEKNAEPPGQFYPSVSSQAFFDDTSGRLNDVLLPLNPYTVQYDTPAGDRHAMYLGYPVGFDDTTLDSFRVYLDDKYSDVELYALFNIAQISTFNYKTYLDDNFGITTNLDYKSMVNSIELTDELEYYLEDRNVEVFSQLKQLVNASPRNAKISGNCGIFRRYGRVLISVLDFHTSELPKAKSLGTLDEQDSIVCRVAQSLDMPYYGVNNCDVTSYLMNNEKTNYMKCLIAAVYANGGVMQTPWNIWAGDDGRYFGDWDEYGAFFQFVRENAQVFDDYDSKGQLAVLWNCDNQISELYTMTRSLYDTNIPFTVFLLGDRYPYSRIDVDRIADGHEQVLLVSNIDSFSDENKATVNLLASKISLVSDLASISLENDWVVTSGDSVPLSWILPRKNTIDNSSDRTIHILNRSYSSTSDDVDDDGFTLSLSSEVFDGLAVSGVSWTGPQTPETELAFVDTADGISVELPQTPIWSVLKVSVYPAADINTDGVVDINDFAMFTAGWRDEHGNIGIESNADLNGDNLVNLTDLYIFTNLWLK